jgi:pimaricinolide synthase PimS1
LRVGEGLALFDAALASGRAVVVPMRVDRGRAEVEKMPALLRGLFGRRARPVAESGQAESAVAALRDRLAAATPDEQDAMVLDLLMPHVAAVLGYSSPGAIETGREFHELGFDSLTAIELRNRLTAATGLRLSATLAFDYPTPAALAGHLRQELMRDAGSPVIRASEETSPGSRALEEIARLEQIIPDMAFDDDARAGLTLRMRALLTALESDQDATENEDLEAATMDNIFELLDQELGES